MSERSILLEEIRHELVSLTGLQAFDGNKDDSFNNHDFFIARK